MPIPRPDLRVMVDANILLAGVIFPRWSWEILRHAMRGDFRLILCPYIIRQANRRITQRFPTFLASFNDFLAHCPHELVPDPGTEDVKTHTGLVRDVTDVPVALAAIQARVDYLVSEDKDLITSDASTQELRRHIHPLIAGTFLRQVMNWSSEELEAVRQRTWDDIEQRQ